MEGTYEIGGANLSATLDTLFSFMVYGNNFLFVCKVSSNHSKERVCHPSFQKGHYYE
jgi:hypothetical protein